MLENTKLEVKENDKIILETYLGAGFSIITDIA